MRGHHVLDLGGADAEGQRAECAMRGGVRVAADDGHARLGGAKLGADHMHDALACVLHIEELDAKLRAIAAQRIHLARGDLIGDDQAILRACGWDVVVHGGDMPVWPAQFASRQAQTIEGLRRCDFMHQMKVDINQRRFARRLGDDVLLPDLLKERLWRFLGLGHRFGSFATDVVARRDY